VSAGTITNPEIGKSTLSVDEATWTMKFDCATDTVQVRGNKVASGDFYLNDSFEPPDDDEAVLRATSVAKSGTKSIVWDVPFTDLRFDAVDYADDPDYRRVELNRVVGGNHYFIAGMEFSSQAPCRGVQDLSYQSDERARVRGKIPDTVKKGRKYRLPIRAVSLRNPFVPAGTPGKTFYSVEDLRDSKRPPACRIVGSPSGSPMGGKYKQFLVGMKPGRECLLSGFAAAGSGGRKPLAVGPVAIIKVTG
jgi:hypothetical protein